MRVEQFVHAMRQSHLDPGAPICVAVDGSYKHVTGISAPDGDAVMIPTIETGQEVDWRWPHIDGPSMASNVISADADVARDAAEALLVRATDEGIIKGGNWQKSTPDGQRFLVNFGTGDGLEEYTASEVVGRLNNPEFVATIRRSQPRDVPGNTGRFDFPRLRKMLDECVRTLNDVVVAQTKDDGFDMPVGIWKAIEQADTLVNSARDAIPMRTVIRYPAWLDVYVDTTVDDHRISKVTAIAQASDAGNLNSKVSGFAIEHDDPDVADSVLRFTDEATWPDPKLEG